jgi:hypothetical protein
MTRQSRRGRARRCRRCRGRSKQETNAGPKARHFCSSDPFCREVRLVIAAVDPRLKAEDDAEEGFATSKNGLACQAATSGWPGRRRAAGRGGDERLAGAATNGWPRRQRTAGRGGDERLAGLSLIQGCTRSELWLISAVRSWFIAFELPVCGPLFLSSSPSWSQFVILGLDPTRFTHV